MSGLLVKSTVVMRENLEEMSRRGFSVPVMLGGAALTRRYVEEDCVKAYASGRVAYAGDAFDGLHLMDKVMTGNFDRHLDEFKAWAQWELRPILQRLVDTAIQQDIMVPQAVYGYWKCAATGNDVILYAEDGTTELLRFTFPRQNKDGGLCIADFFRDVTD